MFGVWDLTSVLRRTQKGYWRLSSEVLITYSAVCYNTENIGKPNQDPTKPVFMYMCIYKTNNTNLINTNICLSIGLSVCLSTYLSIYLSIYLHRAFRETLPDLFVSIMHVGSASSLLNPLRTFWSSWLRV